LLGFAKLADGSMSRDGFDWSGLLRGSAGAPTDLARRIRFTETGYIVGFGANGNMDAGKVAAAGVRKYRIDGQTGRIHVRRQALPALLLEKERAAILDGWILGAVRQDGRRRFILVDRASGAVRELHQPPLSDDGVAAELWRALHAQYREELPASAAEG
jgi:hypothetical protein